MVGIGKGWQKFVPHISAVVVCNKADDTFDVVRPDCLVPSTASAMGSEDRRGEVEAER